ncbi:MAG: chemotaxis protein MotB [Acidimicrobiales bacterium]
MPRKAVEEDDGPDKSWMESYADAMTLLLAFFIMMFAFALVDETKFHDFKVGMVTALGVSDPVNEKADSLLESGNGIALTVGLSTVPSQEVRNQVKQTEGELEDSGTISESNIEEIRELLENKFEQLGAGEFVNVDIDERGLVIRYDGRVLFRSGAADLGIESDAILAASAEVLELVDNPVDIEGHTDDRPTGGVWISNWELSSARSAAVVRWLIDFGSIGPRRLAAVGVADTRPVVSNDTEENRSQNRRVEVVIRVDGLLESDIDVINPLGDALGEDLYDAPFYLTPVPAPEEANNNVLGFEAGFGQE